ncbi:hypothetical protein JGY90_10340 [Staphylococcus xylosus]|uniref:hypothetical protein n=1 Tax=Staphylococcus xylosus TaxID=1288 RepID=UPI001CDD2805|nr:hypothetical protein [Staphylococcus xylosus]UBV34102.1 hypothetical protein JGY90_10340 [Staphylococcus xylosus]
MKKFLFLLLASLFVLSACGDKNTKPTVKKYSYHPKSTVDEIKDKAIEVSNSKRTREFDSDKYFADHEYGELFVKEIEPFTEDDSSLNELMNSIGDIENIDKINEDQLNKFSPAIKELKETMQKKENREKDAPKHLKLVDDNYNLGIKIFYTTLTDTKNVIKHKDEFNEKQISKQEDIIINNFNVASKYFEHGNDLMKAVSEAYEENGTSLDSSD